MNLLTFALAAGLLGAALGKVIAWLAHAIPHRMELAWYQEAQDAMVVDPEDVLFDPSKPAPRPSVKEFAFLSVLCALLCASSAWLSNGQLLQSSLFSCFLMGLVLLSWIDARTYLLPDSLVYSLLWLGLAANLRDLFVPLEQAVVGAMAGYLSFWLIAKAFALVRGKQGMGHGDFKLLAAMGAWLGWTALPWLVVFACVVGLGLAMGRAAVSGGKRSGAIPFGPALSISGASLGFLQIAHPGGITGFLRIFNLA